MKVIICFSADTETCIEHFMEWTGMNRLCEVPKLLFFCFFFNNSTLNFLLHSNYSTVKLK